MKEKMKAKGKISDSGSDGEDDEFAEFMRWKQQKRKAQVKILTPRRQTRNDHVDANLEQKCCTRLKRKIFEFFPKYAYYCTRTCKICDKHICLDHVMILVQNMVLNCHSSFFRLELI